jgi:hypothetical protein
MALRVQKMEHESAQMTWGYLGIGVIAFLFIFIALLYCIHRRNVQQIRKKNTKVNNINVKKQMQAKDLEVNQTEELVSTTPEKLLIKRSDV